METRCFNRYWVGVVCAGLIFTCGYANQAASQAETGTLLKSAKTDFAHLPRNIIEDSKDTFTRRDNFAALLIAGGASAAMHNDGADDRIARHFEKHNTLHGFADESLNIVGGPAAHFSATALWYALSVKSQDEFNKERAWTMMRALSVTGAVTVSLKAARGNNSPNGSPWAWPSGHTSSSFTVASVLDEFYGPRVGIPAYILASAVAYRMMDTGDHWGSDVVFGATLGWVVGHSVAGKHKKLELAGFEMVPCIPTCNGPVTGINLVKLF